MMVPRTAKSQRFSLIRCANWDESTPTHRSPQRELLIGLDVAPDVAVALVAGSLAGIMPPCEALCDSFGRSVSTEGVHVRVVPHVPPTTPWPPAHRRCQSPR